MTKEARDELAAIIHQLAEWHLSRNSSTSQNYRYELLWNLANQAYKLGQKDKE